MIKELENEIRDLKKELAEVQKDQAELRFQSCQGDPEIRKKDGRIDALVKRERAVNDTIRGMVRKRQLMLSESALRTTYNFPDSF